MTAFRIFIVASLLGLITAATSASSSPKTVGDQCNRVMKAFCSRATACGVRDESECVRAGVNAWCQGTCGEAAHAKDVDIDTCVQATNTVSCSSFKSAKSTAAGVPAACRTAVRHAAVAGDVVAAA